jgi:flagellar biosynthesis/type III secretory pathway protein FliH
MTTIATTRATRARRESSAISKGFRDGYDRGSHEGRENDPNDFREPDWRRTSRGYQQWMGSVEAYQNAYRHGYSSGFRAGYQSVNRSWGDRDRDRDEGIYDRGDYAGYDYGRNIGYQAGYQDGLRKAREDIDKDKPFNANPRGEYDDRDHGYRREYGDKNNYRSQYTRGYRDGYESAFRRY